MMSFILFIREMQWHNKSFDMLCFVFFFVDSCLYHFFETLGSFSFVICHLFVSYLICLGFGRL